MKYVLPKGTFDILPEEPKEENRWKESVRWNFLESTIRSLARTYGYQEIRTPIFEQTDLFIRGVGETSDIVSKEMYIFQDKSKRSMSLRPEGTASVMRAFATGQLQQLGNYHKFFYIGPFFRYDRPQAGRYRQFHQFGVEAIGNKDPEQDFETIALLYHLYETLGLKNLKVMVNCLGTAGCRETYKKELLAFLKPHFSSLSEESQVRFEKNPLRILDTKDPSENALLEKAPSILDFISEESKDRFRALCRLLEAEKLPFTVTPTLVRGLDYYNQTVFEITSDVLGAQNTIGAGGRYDGLLPAIGGPDLPCIGFSTGMERILQTMAGQKISFPEREGPKVVFIPLSSEGKQRAFSCLNALRKAGISSELAPQKKIQKALQFADQLRATYAVIIGEEELKENHAQIKNMKSRESTTASFDTLVNYFGAH